MPVTTKARPKKANSAVELERLEADAEKARQEAGELAERVRVQEGKRQQLSAELARLAHSGPDQFDANGLPRLGTDSAKLKAAIGKLDQSQLGAVAEGAQGRVRPAEDALARYVGEHADLLARKEYEQHGRHAVELMQRGAALIAEGYGEYVASEQRQRGFAVSTAGLDGQDIVSDARAAEANRVAQDLADLAPPRSKSLTPLESEEVPRKLRAKGGGFVEAGHLRGEDIHPDQPQRVAA